MTRPRKDQYGYDREALADFALSLLDETPVDDAWLESVGFTAPPCRWESFRDVSIGDDDRVEVRCYRSDLSLDWWINGVELVNPPKTRGQVRALLFALGLEAKDAD